MRLINAISSLRLRPVTPVQPHFPGGAVARRTTTKWVVDEGVEVKSVVDSLIAGDDLGKRPKGKTAPNEQRLAIAADKLETSGTLRKEPA
jgi:hypothetical protein